MAIKERIFLLLLEFFLLNMPFITPLHSRPLLRKLQGDLLTWYRKDNKLVLQGNVYAEFGSFTLSCQKLIVYGKIDNPTKINAEKQVKLINTKDDILIEADKMDYCMNKIVKYIFYNSKLKSKNNFITAEKFFYYPNEDKLEAYGGIKAELDIFR